ncbi:MAG: DUF4097 family beta strand repeat-containing protein [Eubacteriales bacterium]
MKDNDKRKMSALVRLIIFGVAAAMLCGVLVWAIRDNTRFSGFFDGEFSLGITGDYYKDGDKYSIGGGSVDAEGVKYIDIDWTSGSVDIVPAQGVGRSSDGAIIFTETSEGELGEENMLRWYKSGDTLYIKIWKSGMIFGISSRPRKSLTVTVPDILFDKLNVESVSASISCGAVNVGKLDFSTTSGDISINGAASNEVETDTVSGKVYASGITASDIECDSVSGDVDVNGTVTDFKASTVSGEVSLYTDTPLTSGKISTTSGDVSLTIPEISVFKLNYDTVSGGTRIALPTSYENGKYYSVNAESGNDAADISVDTVSGSLTVDKSN